MSKRVALIAAQAAREIERKYTKYAHDLFRESQVEEIVPIILRVIEESRQPVCRNPNHALVDGSPSSHEIGPSCMAECNRQTCKLTGDKIPALEVEEGRGQPEPPNVYDEARRLIEEYQAEEKLGAGVEKGDAGK